MREQREPWLRLPAMEPGAGMRPRLDPRFRTHVVADHRANPPPAEPLPEALGRPPLETEEPELVLSVPVSGAVPTPAAIERAAAAAAISKPATARPAQQRGEPSATPLPAPRSAEDHAPWAAEVGLGDLPAVSSADWATKVGDAAKMVDVVVVFYTAAHSESEMFELAFRTVVNEVLPQLGRPYAVYRFSLDDEPNFVSEMAESLGLGQDDPVTAAGFAWSGPGRRLFLLGDRALRSPAVLQRSLRHGLMGQPTATGAHLPPVERVPGPRAHVWGGRVLAILAWCLFGTAALGAAVVGVAPQWASALLHPAALTEPTAGPKDPPRRSDAPSGAAQPVAASLGSPAAVSPSGGAQASPPPVNAAKPAQAPVKKKRPASTLTANPTYWGLPEGQPR